MKEPLVVIRLDEQEEGLFKKIYGSTVDIAKKTASSTFEYTKDFSGYVADYAGRLYGIVKEVPYITRSCGSIEDRVVVGEEKKAVLKALFGKLGINSTSNSS